MLKPKESKRIAKGDRTSAKIKKNSFCGIDANSIYFYGAHIYTYMKSIKVKRDLFLLNVLNI